MVSEAAVGTASSTWLVYWPSSCWTPPSVQLLYHVLAPFSPGYHTEVGLMGMAAVAHYGIVPALCGRLPDGQY